jgi:hypothetical protein
MKFLLATVTLAALVGSASADTLTFSKGAVEVEMKKGAFEQSSRRVEQLLTVTNRSKIAVNSVRVECGFFHDDLLIGRDFGWADKLQPGQSGYVQLSAYVLSVNRTDCRIVSANE